MAHLVFGPKAQRILKQYFVWDLNRRLFPIRHPTVSNNIKRACEVAFGMPKEKLTDDQRVQAMVWRRPSLVPERLTTTERYAALVPEEVRQVARDRG